jgi:hypothetical protein
MGIATEFWRAGFVFRDHRLSWDWKSAGDTF